MWLFPFVFSGILISTFGFQENYTASRMVLAASGVDHEELLSISEPLLSDLPNVPGVKVPESVYVGGDYRRQADCGVCNCKCILITFS